jgi:peroxiredoxin
MKKLISAALLIIPALGWAQTNTYVLKGKFKSAATTGKIYIQYYKDGKTQKDSTLVQQGGFELKGQSDGPQQVYVTFVPKQLSSVKGSAGRDSRSIFIDQGVIVLNAVDSIKTAIISGAPINADFEKYQTALNSAEAELKKLRKAYYALTPDQRKDKTLTDELEDKMDKAEESGKTVLVQFVKQNPGSYFSLQAIQKVGGSYFDLTKVEPLFASLSARLQSSKGGEAMREAIAATKATAVGQIAPEFTQLNTERKPVKLSDFRGQYVLVDFWASWCGPCRAENPKVLKAYNEFKDKNFTVLGVSVDLEKDRDKWLKAIKDDGMPWMQVVDPNPDNKKGAGNLYAIKAIPSNFLIDPKGVIVAKNLRGDALEKKLAEILK